MKQSEQLQYYQKHAKEAFHDGFTAKIHNKVEGSEVYEVFKYYLPCHLAKKVKWVRKYFKFQDNQPIDIMYKRRKHFCEFAETAMMILHRIHFLTSKGHVIVAGSSYICALPWAIFGTADPSRMAQHNFEDVNEIARFYHNVLHGPCYPVDLCFRHRDGNPPDLLHRIADKFPKAPKNSPNYWMAVAIALMYDIIHLCGPDTSEFFELFTNDYRENIDNMDIRAWQILRCKMLGVEPPPEFREVWRTDRIPKGAYSIIPRKPRKMKTEIKEISNCQDLALGEKVYPLFIKVNKADDDDEPLGPLTSETLRQIPIPIPYRADDIWPEDIGCGVHKIRHGGMLGFNPRLL